MNTECFDDFETYVKGQIEPAVSDVAKLADANRKHIQKLLYTNLVDRFDAMVDAAIVDNCRNECLVDRATGSMSQTITEADLLKLLMESDTIEQAIDEKLKMALRNTVLRERHSKKLTTLFLAFSLDIDYRNKPKVNINKGTIIEKMKPQNKTVPHSICGYADWLYSRRNAVVHGAGTNKYLQNDRAQIEKLYKCKVAKTHRIKLPSISTASTFYLNVVELLRQ